MYRLIAMITTFIFIFIGGYTTSMVHESHRLVSGVVTGIVAVIPNAIVSARDGRRRRDRRELAEEIAE
ncbi:hypothetical protein J4760_12245 [Salinicoccus sp. ID82-1]|uniref:hypothetical protein n=1 Tax=Salinicoccus sp. ID82-1 TaxID=2820269 RepID=UPI001F28328D|nr:hypothetical protein [Salinicoccus sp. ID82-1]MCG1010791.1 hypothetical protein [Salinicoccus sp. ID82-1]